MTAIETTTSETSILTLTYPGIVLTHDPENDDFTLNDRILTLTDSSGKILECLMKNAGRIQSVHALLDAVYGEQEYRPGKRIITVWICRIRKELEIAGGTPARALLKTMPYLGFVLDNSNGNEQITVASFASENLHLAIDSNHAVRINGNKVRLTKSECAVLCYLMDRPGKVLSKELFMEIHYATSSEMVSVQIFDVLISKLRKKLKPYGGDPLIRTVWGRGYLFGIPDPVVAKALTSKPGAYVTTPDGRMVTVKNLPRPGQRWGMDRKSAAVSLVRGAVISIEYLLARYPDLSKAEFERWNSSIEHDGVNGLRITKFARPRQCAA